MSVNKLRSFVANAFSARSFWSWTRGNLVVKSVWRIDAVQAYTSGATYSQIHVSGDEKSQAYVPGAESTCVG